MTLVIHPPVDDLRLTRIREAARDLPVINCQSTDEALAAMPTATAFFGKLTPEFLAEATQLRWVQSPTASLEHYLFPALIEHPCQLSNMRGLFSDVIADHVLGYLLCIVRNLHLYIRQQSDGCWAPVGGESERQSFATGPGTISGIDRAHRQLADCTLGIVGVGCIGQEIARRAASFGMTIHGVDPLTRSVPEVIENVWPVGELPSLLSESDFVCIAAPHTPETERMFRMPQFQQMRRDAWLVNIGRGAIVDLGDLTEALQAGMIGGAALDVLETEPLPAGHPLWKMENVIITPHVAAASPRIAGRHLETLLENIRRFVDGQPPATLVNKRLWF